MRWGGGKNYCETAFISKNWFCGLNINGALFTIVIFEVHAGWDGDPPLLSPFVAPKLPFLVLRLHLSSFRVSWLTTLYYWQVNNQRASQRHSGEESACNVGDARDAGSIPGSGRFPGRRTWQPTPVFLPVKLHEQRSLVGYTPWGCKLSQ